MVVIRVAFAKKENNPAPETMINDFGISSGVSPRRKVGITPETIRRKKTIPMENKAR